MPTCLVLGGAGFIGSHLTDALARAGHRVRAFDRPHADSLAPLADRGYEIVTGDFLNPHDLVRALRGSEIVFHLVSTTLPQTSNDNPAYDVETNVLGTLRVTRALLPKLEALTQDSVKSAVGNMLTGPELEAMLKRRDILVAHFKKLIAERGESNVLY